MDDWKEQVRPACDAINALPEFSRHALFVAMAAGLTIDHGVNRIIRTGEFSGEPVGVLVVRGERLTKWMEKLAVDLGMKLERQVEEDR